MKNEWIISNMSDYVVLIVMNEMGEVNSMMANYNVILIRIKSWYLVMTHKKLLLNSVSWTKKMLWCKKFSIFRRIFQTGAIVSTASTTATSTTTTNVTAAWVSMWNRWYWWSGKSMAMNLERWLCIGEMSIITFPLKKCRKHCLLHSSHVICRFAGFLNDFRSFRHMKNDSVCSLLRSVWFCVYGFDTETVKRKMPTSDLVCLYMRKRQRKKDKKESERKTSRKDVAHFVSSKRFKERTIE